MGRQSTASKARQRPIGTRADAANECAPSVSTLPEIVDRAIVQLATRHHRLLLIVGPHGSGKTRLLRACEQRVSGIYLNLNLALSQRLLEFKAQDRPVQALNVLNDLLAGPGLLLVDNIELLFEPTLQLDPLRALKSASRRHSMMAAWPGTLDKGHLTYAVPGHPEYRRYEPGDLEDTLALDMTTLLSEV